MSRQVFERLLQLHKEKVVQIPFSKKNMLNTHFAGNNHPLRVGPSVGTVGATHQTSLRTPWPKRLTTHTTETFQLQETSGGGLRPIVLPKFVSNPEIVDETGYQKAHQLYDEMQQFFTRKAMVEHQNDVVKIKVTMMLLKPGYRNPQVVSVCDED